MPEIGNQNNARLYRINAGFGTPIDLTGKTSFSIYTAGTGAILTNPDGVAPELLPGIAVEFPFLPNGIYGSFSLDCSGATEDVLLMFTE